MLRSDHPLLPVAAGVTLCAAPLAGTVGAWLAYLAVAAVAVMACLGHRQRSPFFMFGLATVAFAVARTVAAWTEGDTIPELAADVVAYVLLLIGAARLFRNRISKVEPETVLEMIGLACLLATAVVGALAYGITPDGSASFSVIASVASGALVSSALFGRRSHPVMRWLLAAALSAVVVEILLWNITNESVTLAAAAIPYIPLTLSARSTTELTVERVSVRRTFGRRQLLALTIMMVLPTLVLLKLASNDDLSMAAIVLPAGIVGSIAMALRVLLVVRLRDWSYDRERDIRAFGEQLVAAKDIDEAVTAAVETMDRLTSSTSLVGIVKLDGEGGKVIATSGPVPGRHKRYGRSTPKTKDFGTRTRADLPSALYMVELAESVIAIDVPGDQHFLLFGAANTVFRPELEELFKDVANHLSIVLETTSLREEIHKERVNRQFKSLAQDSNDLIMVVDPDDLTALFVGPTISRLLGYEEADYLDKPVLHDVAPEDLAVAERTLRAATLRDSATHCDVRMKKQDGSNNWFGMSARPLEPDSEIQGLLVSFSNIHDRKMAEFLVRQAESLYRALVQKSTDIFALVTPELTIDYISPNVQNLIGYPAEDLLGARLTGLLTERSAEELSQLFDDDLTALDGSIVELEIRTAARGSILAEVALSDPELTDHRGMLLIIRDVTARRHLENSLRNRATHDQLTGLLNRPSFERALQGGLQRLSAGNRLGVISLDLKDFKEVNDSAGFVTGNQLLIEVGNRLRSALRDQDFLARLVADEFAIIASGQTEEALVGFANRLRKLFDEPFHLDGRARKLEVSMGMVTTDDSQDDARKLLQAATVAVHQAKTQETPEIVVFEQSLQDQVDERFELMTDMQTALEEDQFAVVYQPLISFESQEVHSFEALLRWAHPTRGNISPATFIPLAEKSGMIVELGRWVLEQSCRQIVQWRTEFEGFPRAQMAVNLSARQLERDGELEELLRIIHSSGVDCSDLTFELTESIMLKDASWIRDQLTELRNMGIEIAIDDFGTGASGLNHLRELPFDIVKIDKSYVDKVGVDPDGENLVSQIIDLAKGLDARTVAEGIETPAQADVLDRMGCDIGQGFYLAKPMDRDRIESWIQVRRRAELPKFSLERL
jgi:diguanylate cyclase (GGDEF)-like protein/PAS domain S-box-containing protein